MCRSRRHSLWCSRSMCMAARRPRLLHASRPRPPRRMLGCLLSSACLPVPVRPQVMGRLPGHPCPLGPLSMGRQRILTTRRPLSLSMRVDALLPHLRRPRRHLSCSILWSRARGMLHVARRSIPMVLSSMTLSIKLSLRRLSHIVTLFVNLLGMPWLMSMLPFAIPTHGCWFYIRRESISSGASGF